MLISRSLKTACSNEVSRDTPSRSRRGIIVGLGFRVVSHRMVSENRMSNQTLVDVNPLYSGLTLSPSLNISCSLQCACEQFEPPFSSCRREWCLECHDLRM
ncbi:hypothetical protein CEXT_634481 [Caerostris extrusa]|uniref:Uncharacterized protein n=1 Tax=Caerostris extrusa TaxID=172846 RepID=A0AAV4RAM3_CAEEX|nr:hypothetical protein CEXT_634481 [Caerostris extrusa]